MRIDEIEKKLAELPDTIYQQSKKVLDAEKDYNHLELTFDVSFAKSLVESKRGNATEKKQEAVIETEELHRNLLEAEWTLKKEVIYKDALRDQFDSVRKLANLEQERMRSQLA